MNPERFTQPSGRLIQRLHGETPYWAFVPAPLPPAIPPDADLLRELGEARGALGELAGAGRLMTNPHLLIQPFIRREALLSSRIEGTQTEIADLYAYEAGQLSLPGLATTPAGISDAREVSNYVAALEYGLERGKTLPVSKRLIKELHRRLMEGTRGEERAHAGEFRRTQNLIGNRGDMPWGAKFVPPPPEELLPALDSFEKFLHAEANLDPLIRLALIHYQFEAIHPFADGNGRIGRLLISLLLVEWGLLSSPMLYLSAYFEARRQAYYDHLLAVSEQSAWREWILFFLRGVREQAQDAAVRTMQLQDLQARWREEAMQGRSTLPLRLVDHLFINPFLTITYASQLLEVTYPSARRAVERLVSLGILTLLGEATYDKFYIARDILLVVFGQESA